MARMKLMTMMRATPSSSSSSSLCSSRMILVLCCIWLAIRWDSCCCCFDYSFLGNRQSRRRRHENNNQATVGRNWKSHPSSTSSETITKKQDYFNNSSSRSREQQQQQQQQQVHVVAFDRAKEVAWILITDVVVPLVQSLWKMGRIPMTADDWEDFWSFPSSGKRSSNNNANDMIPPPPPPPSSSTTMTLEEGDDEDNQPEINNAQRVGVALERLGPTFVKFGQALSTRPDIIPTTLANALLRLTDRMEPFDTAIAKSIIRQELLSLSSSSTSSSSSSSLVLSPLQIDDFIENLSPKPVAAASIGQVYFGFLDMATTTTANDATRARTRMKVAVKVKRPGIRDTVLRDAAFLKMFARWIDQLSSPFGASNGRSGDNTAVIATRLENPVDEFLTRIFEELDYRREAMNVQTFARLYSHRRHENSKHYITTSSSSTSSTCSSSSKIQVVVPELVPELCTQEILVMEWLNGTKFDAVPVLPNVLDDTNNALLTVSERKQVANRKREIAEMIEQDLKLVQAGIQCTLSQLIETGILHADPHPGNLLKVLMPKTQLKDRAANAADNDVMLGYLDFGLLATIPETVRDALICSVAQLVFARNIDAMARLFIDLQLLPSHRAILFNQDPVERAVFTQALNETLDKVLQFPDKDTSSSSSSPSSSVTSIPILRFDNLLGGLTSLVARFEFQLPPYFLNNARALATLEGVARRLDPTFNVLQIMYPFALNRLLNNPSQSPIVDDTLMSLLRSPDTNTVEMHRIQKLLDDSALFTGYSRRRVLRDVLTSKGGRRTIRKVLREMLLSLFTTRRRRRGKDGRTFGAKRIIFRL